DVECEITKRLPGRRPRTEPAVLDELSARPGVDVLSAEQNDRAFRRLRTFRRTLAKDLPQSEVLSPGGLPLEARGRAGIRLARPFPAPEIGRGDWTTRPLFECAGEFDPGRAVPSRTGQSAPKEERVEFTRSKGDDLGAELFPAEHALVLTLEGE